MGLYYISIQLFFIHSNWNSYLTNQFDSTPHNTSQPVDTHIAFHCRFSTYKPIVVNLFSSSFCRCRPLMAHHPPSGVEMVVCHRGTLRCPRPFLNVVCGRTGEIWSVPETVRKVLNLVYLVVFHLFIYLLACVVVACVCVLPWTMKFVFRI